MDTELGDALVEVCMCSLELLGSSLGVIEALWPDAEPTARDIRTACMEAVVFARSFRDVPGPAMLGERIDWTRARFERVDAQLRRLLDVCPRLRPSLSAGIEIAERGSEAAARATRRLGSGRS